MRRIDEIPLRANMSVHQLNELTGDIVTSRDTGLSINRYLYFPDQPLTALAERDELIATVREILSGLGAEPTLLLSWRKGKPTAARSRLTYSKRHKEGWEISEGTNIWLATKSWIDDFRVPTDYQWQEGGLIILIGGQYRSVIQAKEAVPTLEDLALTGELRPGLNFIKLLHLTNTSCIYFAFGEDRQIEPIVLTNSQLP